MKRSFKFFLLLSLLPFIAYTQEIRFVKDQTSPDFVQQYHVLAANPKIRQGLYQSYFSASARLMEEGYYKNNQKDKYLELL